MIEKIYLRNEASFDEIGQSLNGLKEINFIYGANGSGKTTISRVISDEDQFNDCSVVWKAGNKLEVYSYNRDFVERNFHQDRELKGIFTLGEKDDSILKAIAETKKELDQINQDVQGKKKTLEGEDGKGGKKSELEKVDHDFEDICWDLKGKYDEFFKAAFTGVRDKKVKIKSKIEQEAENNNSELLNLEDLKKKAKTVFSDDIVKEQRIPPLLYSELIDLENDGILIKKVIGKDDVDIAAMIKKLGNSDWVKEGRHFFEKNAGYCPFCQQSTDAAFSKSLNEYFDETYLADMNAIDDLASNYETYSQTVLQRLQSIIEASPKYLDCARIQAQMDLVQTKTTTNKQHINRKKREPSLIIKMESLGNSLDEISTAITAANDQIDKHNLTVENISAEKKDLTSKVWKFIINDIQASYNNYKRNKNDIEAAISGLKSGIRQKQEEKTDKISRLQDLEKNITSIQPAIDGINKLLQDFGFSGFSLAKSEKEGCYKIVRPDGKNAKETLSEGERTFITFLYFYYLLKGSTSESGITTDRVVVFDDPVSSLDSDILFIVSNLIKGILEEIRPSDKKIKHYGDGQIKQVFILTHNIYFHREITFHKKRGNGAMKEETFWIIKKSNDCSKMEKCEDNPIKTSYELLWNEVKDSNRSTLTIQNTLRRILENYFKILGNIDNDEIINMFEGKEKIICSSLFSWVNAGSHVVNDDLYLACGPETVDKYLDVFKDIFEKSGHIAHYNMMMDSTATFS